MRIATYPRSRRWRRGARRSTFLTGGLTDSGEGRRELPTFRKTLHDFASVITFFRILHLRETES